MMAFEQEMGEHMAQLPATPVKLSVSIPNTPWTTNSSFSETFSPFNTSEFSKKLADLNGSPTIVCKRHQWRFNRKAQDKYEFEDEHEMRSDFADALEDTIEAEALRGDEVDHQLPGLGVFLDGCTGKTSEVTLHERVVFQRLTASSEQQSSGPAISVPKAGVSCSSTPHSDKGLRAFPPEVRNMIFRNVINRRETTVRMLPIFKALLGDKDLLAEAIKVHQRVRIYFLKLSNAWKLDLYSDQLLVGIENLSISFYYCDEDELWHHLESHLRHGRLQQLVSLQISIRNFMRGGPGYLNCLLHLFLQKCKNLQYIFVRSNAKIPQGSDYLEEIARKLGRGGWLTRIIAGHEHLVPSHRVQAIEEGDIDDGMQVEEGGSSDDEGEDDVDLVEVAGIEGFELKWCWYSKVGWGTEWNQHLKEKDLQNGEGRHVQEILMNDGAIEGDDDDEEMDVVDHDEEANPDQDNA